MTSGYIMARCDASDSRAHDWIVVHIVYDPE